MPGVRDRLSAAGGMVGGATLVRPHRDPRTMPEVRRLRDAQGLSQTALARAAGVSSHTVRQWENRGRCPWRSTLEAVAAALNVDAAALDPACWATRTKERYGADPAGMALQRLRRAAGLSVDDVTRAIGTTRSAVGHWESGSGSPHPRYRDTLARLYGVEALPLPAKRVARETPPAPTTRLPPPGIDGARVRALRRDRGWTQAEVAEMVGASASAMARWEALSRTPTRRMWERLAAALDTTVAALAFDEEAMDAETT